MKPCCSITWSNMILLKWLCNYYILPRDNFFQFNVWVKCDPKNKLINKILLRIYLNYISQGSDCHDGNPIINTSVWISNVRTVPSNFLFSFLLLLLNLSILLYRYFACLSVCSSVRYYPINFKTAKPKEPKFRVGPYMTPGKVYWC